MFKTVLCSAGFHGLNDRLRRKKKDKQATIATTPAEVKDPTSIQLIDSVYDFGKVTEGEIVEYSYRFKNTGDKPLVVSEILCQLWLYGSGKTRRACKAGWIGFIKVKFNSDHRPGEAHKTITVNSNAKPAFPEVVAQRRSDRQATRTGTITNSTK